MTIFKKNPKKEKTEKSVCSKVNISSFVPKPAGRRGISFIETLIAIAIFSLVIMVATSVAAVYLRNRKIINQYQEASEELSLTLNYLSKELRMSSPGASLTTNGEKTTIATINNHDAEPVTYAFVSGNLNKTIGGATSVVVSDVSGRFYVYNVSAIPRITIVLWKTDQTDRIFQTTVSLRSGYK